MIWFEIILLIIKFGPVIVQLVLAIIDLISKQPKELQPKYKAELIYACKLMRKNKIMGNNALLDLKQRLEAPVVK